MLCISMYYGMLCVNRFLVNKFLVLIELSMGRVLCVVLKVLAADGMVDIESIYIFMQQVS